MMGRAPCCENTVVKKGPWTPEEDKVLVDYIEKNGHGSWRQLPKLAGLNRCGKSCRLRWTNYLRPDIKRGKFSEEEERQIIHLHSVLGNKWSAIATRLPGRTDNEVKNHWNTHLRKKMLQMGLDPVTHRPRTDLNLFQGILGNMRSPWDTALRIQANAALVTKLQLLQRLVEATNTPMLGSASVTNHQLNAPAALGTLTDPIASASPFSSFQDLASNYVQPSMATESSVSTDGGCLSEQLCKDANGGSTNDSYMNPIANSVPSLPSAENNTVKEKQGLISGSFQDSDGLNLDHIGNDLSWKDILDQISWSDDL